MTHIPLMAVIDDDVSVRRSIRRILESEGYRAIEFSSATEYLSGVPDPPCDCLILDLQMPGMTGTELQQALIAKNTLCQIIFISAHGDIASCVEAMKYGAVDFLQKPFSRENLLDAIKRALSKAEEMRNERKARAELRAARETARTLIARLTPRELDVFRGIIAGQLNKQIAASLGTAEKTVKIQRGNITSKLGITAVADMVRLAQTAGINPGSR